MRNQDEQMEFCASIMSVASGLGIMIGYVTDGAEAHRYTWSDYAVGALILCPVAKTQRDALESACEALVQYLTTTQHG